MSYKYVVITHKNCPDGFSAAWVIWTKYKNNAIYLGYNAGSKQFNHFNEIINKIVIITDISFSLKITKKLEKLSKKIIIIDHHDTYYEELKKLPYFQFNNKYSAAYLTWKYIYQKQKMPEVIKIISDNDTGTWKIPYSKQFALLLKIKFDLDLSNTNFKKFTKLTKKNILKKNIKIGSYYIEYQNKIIDLIIKRSKQKMWNNYKIQIIEIDIPLLNGNIATKLSKIPNIDIGIVYRYNKFKKVYIITMRTEKNNIHLGKLASKYGGGGHLKAASFAISKMFI